MTDADRRALTPLFWTHGLYGKFDLDMSTHLDLAALTPITVGRQEPMVATVL